ncbi:uncharacterized protein BJ212DRAFT_1262234 [Suillus subaureus]|uniref:RRM domain-containing protein n=1 Tax=Suillus subaureus TaxID=48587 RepID=A0A9P7EJH4_9AGAM|nr:uncharacterized protein BJ212DRAFT_1262234 [Suillus subaureus]KAG1823565.1 hypothetical protein BJ212DRAFT_1262234 [Suillus subaureus]
MSTRDRPQARITSYHGAKRNLLGNQAGNVPPAWRDSKDKQKERGSKILLSRLPVDVGETEVEELFKKTIGPLKECFVIYNTQGRSKGMAVITFQRPGDAAAAREKYDGKLIDGRRPIKIEIIVDSDDAAGSTRSTPASAVPSLLGRIGKVAGTPKSDPLAPQSQVLNGNVPPIPSQKIVVSPRTVQTAGTKAVLRRRKKKGPRRINKSNVSKKSLAELDQDMEEYKAAASGHKESGDQ